METPGSFLRRERALRGITLDEISEETKISKRALKALEEDDFDSIAAPTFVKGFLMAYSKYVGLDGNDMILRYEDFMEKTTKEKASKEKKEERKPGLPKSRTITVAVILGFIAVLALYLLLRVVFQTPEQGEKELKIVAPDKSVADIFPEEKDVTKKEVAFVQTRPSERKVQEDHTLSFKALQDTWIWIWIDDKIVKEVLLRSGDRIEWKGEKGFFVIVGNAGGVTATLNGKSLGALGKAGEIVRLTLPEKNM